MFGLDDALIWGPMIGAAAGGLLSKKNPMKGALLGAGLGLGGGLIAPQLAATEAAAGAAGQGLALGAGGETGLTLGAGTTGLTAPSAALTPAAAAPAQAAAPSTMSGFMNNMRPVTQAMDAASRARQSFGGQDNRPIIPPPIVQAPNSTGPQGLAQLATNAVNVPQSIQNETAMRNEIRQRRLDEMRRAYGLA